MYKHNDKNINIIFINVLIFIYIIMNMLNKINKFNLFISDYLKKINQTFK